MSGLNRKFISQKNINDKERKKLGKKRQEQKNEMNYLLEQDKQERLRLLEKKNMMNKEREKLKEIKELKSEIQEMNNNSSLQTNADTDNNS